MPTSSASSAATWSAGSRSSRLSRHPGPRCDSGEHGKQPMTDRQPSAGAEDLRAHVRRAVASLEKPPRHAERPATTDLSLDEELCLHAVGWEPFYLVVGIS